MKAILITPKSESVKRALEERLEPEDPKLVKARIKVDWKDGSLRIRHPNFRAVLLPSQRREALQNAKREAIAMLSEFTIEEDFEVKAV